MQLAKYKNWLKEAHNLFLVISLVLGLAFVAAVPPLWGFDETSHFARVYEVSEGSFLLSGGKDGTGNTMPKSFNIVSRYATADIGEQKDPNVLTRNDVNNYGQYKHLLDQKFSKQTETAINPAGYSPLTYPISEILVFFARTLSLNIDNTLLLSRLGGLLSYITLGYFAIRFLRELKSRWLIVVVALSPVMMMQAATLSADTLVNGVALLFVSLIVLAFVKPEKITSSQHYVLAGLAIYMPLIKLNYLFLSLAVLLLPAKLFIDRRWEWAYKLGATGLSTLFGLLWTFIGMSIASGVGGNAVSPRPDGLPVNAAAQIHYMMIHPFGVVEAFIRSLLYFSDFYITQMFSVLGWNYVLLPIGMTIITLLTIFIAAFHAKDEFNFLRRQSFVIAASCLVGIGSIFAILYVSFSPVGYYRIDGVQGRYFLPFLIPLMIALVNLLPFKIQFSRSSVGAITLTSATTVILVLSLAYYMALTY